MLNSAGFLLCSVGTDGIIGIVVGIVLALIVGAGVAYLIFRYAARKKLGSVKEECARLLDSAKSNADTYLKEARLEIKEEQHKMRSELDKESRERRSHGKQAFPKGRPACVQGTASRQKIRVPRRPQEGDRGERAGNCADTVRTFQTAR